MAEQLLGNKISVSAGGLEPPALCLKGRCSTPELRALKKLMASNIR